MGINSFAQLDLFWKAATPFGLTSTKLALLVGLIALLLFLLARALPEWTERHAKWKWSGPTCAILSQLFIAFFVFIMINRSGWFYSSFQDLFA